MPSRSSFELIWRALDDELDHQADQGLEIGERALWMEFFSGDRRYEANISIGAGTSCQVQLSQNAVDAVADYDALEEDQLQYYGTGWLAVEFCVHGPASEPVDQKLLQRVIEEFWPDVEIYHETVMEAYQDGEDRFPLGTSITEHIQHNHFRFSWLVSAQFVQRIPEFVEALIETMRRLAATVPPGRMI